MAYVAFFASIYYIHRPSRKKYLHTLLCKLCKHLSGALSLTQKKLAQTFASISGGIPCT